MDVTNILNSIIPTANKLKKNKQIFHDQPTILLSKRIILSHSSSLKKALVEHNSHLVQNFFKTIGIETKILILINKVIKP